MLGIHQAKETRREDIDICIYICMYGNEQE